MSMSETKWEMGQISVLQLLTFFWKMWDSQVLYSGDDYYDKSSPRNLEKLSVRKAQSPMDQLL